MEEHDVDITTLEREDLFAGRAGLRNMMLHYVLTVSRAVRKGRHSGLLSGRPT